MSASSIGIQVIMPRTGTSPKQSPQQQSNDRDATTAATAKPAPPPGMGKLMDKAV